MNNKIKQRFWAKVDKASSTDGCWCWIGSKTVQGYGQMRICGKQIYAHRLIFDILGLSLDPELCVLHKCDNRSCVNPEHLFQGTRSDNARDMKLKGRARGADGSKNYNAKLSEANVITIRVLLEQGMTHQAIADRFDVSRTTVTNISNNRIWRCVRS